LAALAGFHAALGALIAPTTELSAASWNPQSQQQLEAAYAALVALGDAAIEGARARLNAAPGWAETVAQFGGQTGQAVERTAGAALAALKAAEADLAATNPAERGLIGAARSVADGQQRLAQLKAAAAAKKASAGGSYIGVETVDIAAPVLNTAARLVEVSRQQVQLLLRRDGNVPNQPGLVAASDAFLRAIQAVIATAEAAVSQAPDAPERLLAAATGAGDALTKFLAEAQQKSGSPELNQVIGKFGNGLKSALAQLRSFAEIAVQAKSKGAAAPAPARAPRQLKALLDLLNAEAKVVQTRKELQLAEGRVKKLKEGS
jgi:hypothetical protein